MMRLALKSSLRECQGGVSTYINALKDRLPSRGFVLVADGAADVELYAGPHTYEGIEVSLAKRRVIVVHDLIPELLWGRTDIRASRQKAIDAADAVIAVSNWTKDDVLREYKVDPNKVHVVYHGLGQNSSCGVSVNNNVVGPYILYVGKRNEYKRFQWFLRAVAPLMWLHPSLRIVCTGEPFCRREWAWILALGLYGRVKVNRYTAEEMAGLYHQAIALVYPSIYEGFGLPILEAMSVGCPVIINGSTCLPEVAGDAAMYFERDNGRSLCHCIKRVWKDRKLADECVRRGMARAQLFSWEKCARETAEILKGLK